MDPSALARRLEALYPQARDWIGSQFLTASTALQIGALLLALLLARWIATRVEKRAAALAGRYAPDAFREVGQRALGLITLPATWLLLAWAALAMLDHAGQPVRWMAAAVSLLAAWVTIRCATLLVRDPEISRLIAVIAWIIATLNILGQLAPLLAVLDGLAVQLGHLRLSALLVLKGLLALVVFLWLAVLASQMMERRIRTLPTLTPSIQVLISKLFRIALMTLAVVGALGIMGIDLTAFAVFTGAIGVGVGFGLQKVVSNLVSGVILLLDKSVKPGDVISVGETYGWINALGARYVSVVTRDGREFLIPNEDLITHQVVNWSYSNNEVRLVLPVGVAYHADVRLAMKLCVEAAGQVPRVLTSPPAQCVLRGFGDNAVNLELRIWINDPQNGLATVQSDVFLAIWDRFHAHGIQIPYPQRDLHLVSPTPVRVVMEPQEESGEAATAGEDPG
jgi:small-conductance mechanosensitive channel